MTQAYQSYTHSEGGRWPGRGVGYDKRPRRWWMREGVQLSEHIIRGQKMYCALSALYRVSEGFAAKLRMILI